MNFFLTLVASSTPLSSGHLARAESFFHEEGIDIISGPSWLSFNKAADICIAEKPSFKQIIDLRSVYNIDKVDIFITQAKDRRKKLLIADMDSTIVNGETLDEMASEAGIKDKIAPITDRAMRGELDFEQALKERVRLLEGLPESVILNTLKKTELNPGAKTLIQSMKQFDATCVLVSGGFTLFTEKFAEICGFDSHHGNVLHVENNLIKGTVGDPILDKNSKVTYLQNYQDALHIEDEQIMAIGDGANDLPMLQTANLGIGYKPKPLLEENLENCIIHGDLSAALFAQGLLQEEFVD